MRFRSTAFGRDKVVELGLSDAGPPSAPEPVLAVVTGVDDRPFLSVAFDDQPSAEGDALDGAVLAAFTERGYDEPTIARAAGDVNGFALWMLDRWWRLLYRRDAPLKLGATFAAADGDQRFSVALRSMGGHIERIIRRSDGNSVPLADGAHSIALDGCERALIDGLLRPAVSRMHARGRFDRPVEARLARLEDTYANPRDLQFARTAGALGSSAYDLDDADAESVRTLVAMIPDEDARLDFASAVLAEQVVEASAWVREETASHGVRNRLDALPALSRYLRPQLETWPKPHRRGTEMARLVRKHLGLAAEVAIGSAADLHALFGDRGFEASPGAPGELRAFQSRCGDTPTVVVGDEGPESTAFTLARAIGDCLAFASPTSCVANLYTERQAVGRAFAAEFIAPRDGVVRMIEDDERTPSQVARHYGTTTTVVRHQWENNRHLRTGA